MSKKYSLSKMMLLSLIAIFMLILAACNSDDKSSDGKKNDPQGDKSSGGEIVYNMVNDIAKWDPGDIMGVDQSEVAYAMFEGLVKAGPNGAIVPGVAKEWKTSEDGRTWTFTLRDNAKWSNGDPVTAHDFEFSWKRVLDPGYASENYGNYAAIKGAMEFKEGKIGEDELGIVALDEHTFQVTTNEPVPYFLETVVNQAFLPVNKSVAGLENSDWIREKENWIGNGPFKLVEWVSKDKFVFEKNEEFWDKDSVKLSKLTFKIIPDDNTSLAAFRTNELDVIKSIPSSEVEKLLADGTAQTLPVVRTYWYSINLGEDTANDLVKEHLWDNRVREALSLAIDRTLITDKVLKRGDVPADAYIPPIIRDWDGETSFRDGKSYFPVEGDVEKAQQLLAEAGYPNGEGFPEFTILYNISEPDEAVALTIQDMWKENLGIQTKLEVKETQVFSLDRQSGNFEITRGGLSGIGDPAGLLAAFKCGNSVNMSIYCDEEYESLFAQAERETDPETRFSILRKMEDKLVEEQVIIPLYYMSALMATQPNVEGVYANGRGAILFDQAEIN